MSLPQSPLIVLWSYFFLVLVAVFVIATWFFVPPPPSEQVSPKGGHCALFSSPGLTDGKTEALIGGSLCLEAPSGGSQDSQRRSGARWHLPTLLGLAPKLSPEPGG